MSPYVPIKDNVAVFVSAKWVLSISK